MIVRINKIESWLIHNHKININITSTSCRDILVEVSLAWPDPRRKREGLVISLHAYGNFRYFICMGSLHIIYCGEPFLLCLPTLMVVSRATPLNVAREYLMAVPDDFTDIMP